MSERGIEMTCPHCGHKLDCHRRFGTWEAAPMRDGAFTMCISCGHLAVVMGAALRKASPREEADVLAACPALRAAQLFVADRGRIKSEEAG